MPVQVNKRCSTEDGNVTGKLIGQLTYTALSSMYRLYETEERVALIVDGSLRTLDYAMFIVMALFFTIVSFVFFHFGGIAEASIPTFIGLVTVPFIVFLRLREPREVIKKQGAVVVEVMPSGEVLLFDGNVVLSKEHRKTLLCVSDYRRRYYTETVYTETVRGEGAYNVCHELHLRVEDQCSVESIYLLTAGRHKKMAAFSAAEILGRRIGCPVVKV